MKATPAEILAKIAELEAMLQGVAQQGRREQCLTLLLQLRRQLFNLGG